MSEFGAFPVAVLIGRDCPRRTRRETPSVLSELFGLTDREAEVASLLTDGLEIPAIALELRISPETARTYLKYAFEKIGVSRQAELVALLARLRPERRSRKRPLAALDCTSLRQHPAPGETYGAE